MSDAHASALAGLIISDAVTFASLPLPLACLVFVALPPDTRGRACCVCRAWRDALADPSLWTRLDMTGVKWQRFKAVLHGATGRARGQLRMLDVSHQYGSLDDVQSVLTANAGSLRELHVHTIRADSNPTVADIVAAAPLLQVLTAEEVTCSWEDAPQMLRAEPPFALLQMRGSLAVDFAAGRGNTSGGMERFKPFALALADAALQPALSRLCLSFADFAQPALMDALVGAMLARRDTARLRELKLKCTPPPAAAPLARLLAEGSLVAFEFSQQDIYDDRWPLLDVAGAALVADALRANTTLTTLRLSNAHLRRDIRVAALVLGALVGHTSLRELKIVGELTGAQHRIAFSAALAALIAADAPALRVLKLACNVFCDAGLATIVDALALNRHLRELDLYGNGISEDIARERLLPALRANKALRKLRCTTGPSRPPSAVKAEQLVRRRGKHK